LSNHKEISNGSYLYTEKTSTKKPIYESKSAIYISVDIECSGPVPIDYSMLSLGACVVGRENDEDSLFYIEIQPISDNYIKEALEVCKFSLSELQLNGVPPPKAMKKFADWLTSVSRRRKPVFVAYPIAFDWSFVNHYFHKFMGQNPFGLSGVDIKSAWIGKTNAKWHAISLDDIKKSLGLGHLKHTHHALQDAKEQSIIFKQMMID
jgi:DNA polymerase III alpha subunit (gram-positive type)